MNRWIPALLAVLFAACSTLPPDDEEPLPPAKPCEPGFTDDFVLGTVVFENPRWFRQFDDGCNTVEMQTGLQGGWHIEPAVQAPRTAPSLDLGGEITWLVYDEEGTQVADGQFELFRSFWQTLEGGDAYWGDFVIFDRNPAELVGTRLTIECELDFDPESSLDDVTLTRVVDFVDERPNTEFD